MVRRPLGWIRAWRRPAAMVALLALLLQLGLSFGHVHVGHSHRPDAMAGIAADGRTAVPQLPDTGDDHDSHYCAIYAVLALLAGAQTAIAPDVPRPITLAFTTITSGPVAARLGRPHAAFRSRAPPLS